MLQSLLKELQIEKDIAKKKLLLQQIIAYYTENGQFEQIKKYASDAVALFSEKERKTEEYAVFLDSLAYAYFHLGDNTQAVTLFYEMEKLGETLQKPYYIVHANRYLGTIYSYMKNYKDAEKKLRLAQTKAEKYGLKNELASTYNSFFMFYRSQKMHDISLEMLKKGLAIAEEIKDERLISIFYSNIGLHYKLVENYKKALSYYKKSLVIKKKTKNNHALSVSYYNIASIYEKIENYDKAEHFYELAYTLAEKAQNNSILFSIYERASEFYEKRGNIQKSIEFYKKRLEMTIKNYDMEQARMLADIETKHELEKKEKESEIYRLKNIELAQAYQKIELQNEELQKVLQSKDAILRIVSHDLKNSVGTVQSVIDLLRSYEIDDESLKKCFSIIEHASTQSITLVNDILQEAAISGDSFALSLEKTSVHDFFTSYDDVLFVEARRKEIIVNTDYDGETCIVMLDIQRFLQVMINIVSNAVKFTNRGGEITLCVEKKDSHVDITVCDNGVGIAEKDLPFVFETFSRTRKRGTENEPTTGLGLSIVKRLVELHNGEISIESKINKGTKVTVSLPAIS